MDNIQKKHKLFKTVGKIMIVITLVISVFSVLIYQKQVDYQKQLFFDVGENITDQTSRALKLWIDEQINVVKTIANDERVINTCLYPNDEEVIRVAEDYLYEMHKRYPYYENIPISIKTDIDIVREVRGKKVVIENGEFLVDSVLGQTLGKGGMEYSYIEEIFNGKDYFISEIYPSILRGNPIFVISCPIKHNNEIVGVAIISPKISYFTQNFIKGVNFRESGYMFFVDERQLVIAHKNSEYVLRDPETIEALFENIVKNAIEGEKEYEGEFLGDKKLYSSTKVSIDKEHLKYGWYIVFTQKAEEIFAGTNKLLSFIIVLLIISVSFIAIIVYSIMNIHQRNAYNENLIQMNKDLERKVEERTNDLKKLAITDSLTMLLNHKTSLELLQKEINNSDHLSKPLSIMMLDLDKFKDLNDTYGHQVGDEVLIAVSNTIKNNIREKDIAGRYGGEEFIVVLPNSDSDTTLIIAEKIRKAISEIRLENEEIKITVSIGVCSWKGEEVKDLVIKVDNLLYKAKEKGRNRIEVILD